jgi:hypothetical protein
MMNTYADSQEDSEGDTYNFDFSPETMRAIEDMIPGFIELMMLFSEHMHIPEKFPEEGFERWMDFATDLLVMLERNWRILARDAHEEDTKQIIEVARRMVDTLVNNMIIPPPPNAELA